MDHFGTDFTVLAASAGSDKKDGKKDDTFLTPKQWALVIIAGVVLAGLIELWLRHSGL
jgi:hypothetical protein